MPLGPPSLDPHAVREASLAPPGTALPRAAGPRLFKGGLGRSALSALLGCLLVSGAAFAADAPLETAHADVTRAISTLKALEAPEESPELALHRKKAIEFLTRAQSELLKAKQVKAPAP